MRLNCRITTFAILVGLACSAGTTRGQTGYFGIAQTNINPTTPIMLSGYAGRAGGPEATSVQLAIGAQAAAFGDGADTALLLSVDATGFPRSVTDAVAARLNATYGIPRERIVITCTHSHNCPHCSGYLDNLFSSVGGLTPDEQQNVDQYTNQLVDKLEAVAVQALGNRTPGHQMQRGQGAVDFAVNRRGTAIAPVDHDLPVLQVIDADGNTVSIVTSYASHAVTLANNRVSGDWPGYAQQYIEDAYPGAIAMVMIGAAGDSNPSPLGSTAYARDHGMSVANEVQRILSQTPLKPVAFGVTAQQSILQLDHATTLAPGDPASARLAPAPAQMPYGITSWSFGDDLAMVFMEGEVTVDYSLRLKAEVGDDRLWVNAYSNAVPGYVPSERILYEGGYEADDSTFWYALPGRLAHGLEDKIVGTVESQLGSFFNPQDRLTLIVDAATGEVTLRNGWQESIAFDAYTISSAGGGLRPQNGAWNSLQDQHLNGWDEATTASTNRLTEFNPHGGLTLASGTSISLGNAYQIVAPSAFGETVTIDDDMELRYSTDGENSIAGILSFIGAANKNNLVLTIDPATGQATIQNESLFFNAAIDGYTITSADGILQIANGQWSSLEDQQRGSWSEADNSNAHRITEFSPVGSLFLGGDGQIVDLGKLVNISEGAPALDDFEFLFTLSDGTVLAGVVVLGELPVPGLMGDANGDEIVNIFDINMISTYWGGTGPRADVNHDGIVNIFDVNAVSANWLATGGSTAVPEPSASTTMLSCLVICVAAKVRARRRRFAKRANDP